MDLIDIGSPAGKDRRDRYFARSAGTCFRALAADGQTTEIELYDEIGFWGVDARAFKEKLRSSTGDIVLKINSPGGDVFDGIAMYNDLVQYPGKVRVEITGLAASAASVVAMAGDTIAMADNAFMMIHNAWVLAVGDRHELADTAALLTKIDSALARTYANRTGKGIRTVAQMMDAETWMSGTEAREAGFATDTLKPVEAKAKFDLSVFSNAPKALVWAGDEAEETERDIEKVLMRDAGYTRSQARARIKDIRTGFKSNPDAKPGAGGLELSGLATSLKSLANSLTR